MDRFTLTGPVFDGEKVYECARVTVENGVITELTPADKTDDSGLFIMPGLIDGHVHLSREEQIRDFLSCGITTVCDISAPGDVKNRRGKLNIHTACIAATGDTDDGRAFVKEAIEAGADYIKLFLEIPPSMAGRTMPQQVLEDIVTSAHENNLKVIAHAASVPVVEMAEKASVDILLHTPMRTPFPEELADRIKAKKLVFMPTILMMKYFTIEPFREYDESGLENAVNAVKLLRDKGVPVLVGTDANDSDFVPKVSHGQSIFTEMEMLCDCGLTPTEVLRGATSKNADAFCLDNIGRIAPGKKADLILIKGRPDKNISDIRNIERIYVSGEKL